MKYYRLLSVILMFTLCLALLPVQSVRAATYTVTTTADSGVGSLRWAIEQVNANPGPDTIQFNIAGCGGVCILQPASPLPILTDDVTTIDGYTQAGASPATTGAPAVIQIQIDGSLLEVGAAGLAVTSADNVIKGLSITNFTWDGIAIGYGDATGNVIAGNYLGIDPDGLAGGNRHSGVYVGLGAQSNLIGGDTPAERNVLSGNAWSGAEIHSSDTTSNTIAGNYIGTDIAGTARMPNTLYGVRVYGGAQWNTIGGDAAGERNVISGNDGDGVRILGTGTDYNTVISNTIGAAADGATALGNTGCGVSITNGPKYTYLGNNVISANEYGVMIYSDFDVDVDTHSNTIVANVIGLAQNGISPLGNTEAGVHIGFRAQSNNVVVNRIAHNGGDGVSVDTPLAFNNLIWLNRIHDNSDLGIDLTNGANHEIGTPVIHDFDPGTMTVSGAACPGCVVQIFASPDDDGEGERFVWAGEAGPAGDFDITVDSLPYPYLTATATNFDDDDGTSEFSEVFTASLIYLPLVTRRLD